VTIYSDIIYEGERVSTEALLDFFVPLIFEYTVTEETFQKAIVTTVLFMFLPTYKGLI
jgi:hypothetical protein